MFNKRAHFSRFPCPKCHVSHEHVRDGRFFRPSDGHWIQRLRCRICQARYSVASFDPAFRQNKRKINFPLAKLLASGVSLRRSAKILCVSRTTIDRKLRFLGKLCQRENALFHASLKNIAAIEFDDLQTIEHSKLKPVSVSLAVEKNTRMILGFEVSKMPATGHLAAISRRKYGKRPEGRPRAIMRLLTHVRSMTSDNVSITSDMHPFYAPIVQRLFPRAHYEQVKGVRGCVTGQGELKKVYFDPLFSLNHTCAMLRANINRLFRRTWCTTKHPDRLVDHLNIYVLFHNRRLLSV